MRRYLATVLISVMLVGLLFIYLVTAPGAAQTNVGRLSIIIMAFALFLGYYSGEERQQGDSIKLLSAVTGLITLAATALVGRRIFNSDVGFVCLPMMFIVIGGVVFAMYMRRALRVEDGYVLVVDRQLGGGNYVRPPGIYPPLIPAVEEAFALLPDYELTTTVDIEQVDTFLLMRPEKISIFARYRIRKLAPSELDEMVSRYDAAMKQAKRERRTKESVMERLSRRTGRLSKDKGIVPRSEWEVRMVGDAEMSPEELADRQELWAEEQRERQEGNEEAWELFDHPHASYLRVAYHFPNRDRAIASLAKEWGLEPEDARLRSEFWTELMRRQMNHEIDEIVRETVHDARGLQLREGKVLWNKKEAKKKRDEDDDDDGRSPVWGAYGPVEISERRHDMSRLVKRRLQMRVRHWGVQVLELEFEHVKLTDSSFQFKYRSMFENIKTLQARNEAEREAERIRIIAEAQAEHIRTTGAAEAEHEAQHIRSRGLAEAEAMGSMVDEITSRIKEANANLTEQEIRHIVFEVMEEQKKLAYRVSPSKPSSKA
jgi:hypothetical protein